ncbi:MAG: general secretion pathway protein GspK [Planctomycetes bacterium]|nr:general secretion pathway protein GspK [Planctomycetota bacterium]
MPEPPRTFVPAGRSRDRRRERGVALLLVMMVVVLVMIVVTALSFSAQVDLRVSTNELDGFSVHYAIRGALHAARFLLKEDGGENSHDGLLDKWAEPEQWLELDFGEDIRLKIDVVDESRKFNLYWLLKGTHTEQQHARDRLISILDVMREDTAGDLTPAEAADLAARIADYIKVRRAGKSKEYEGILLPPTRGNFLLSLQELLPFVGEFVMYDQVNDSGEKLAGLERFVTIWSDGKTNVNTADRVVLQCFFPQHERDKAERILEAREAVSDPERNPELLKPPTLGQQKQERFIGIQSLDDLVKADAISNKDKERLSAFLGTASQVFSVFVTARKQRIVQRHRLVIRRDKTALVTLLSEGRTDRRIELGEEAEDPFQDDEDGAEDAGASELNRLLRGR